MSVPPRHSSCPETLHIPIGVVTAVLVRQPRPSRSDTCGFRKFWVMDSGNFDHLLRPCHVTRWGGKVVALRDGERALLVTR